MKWRLAAKGVKKREVRKVKSGDLRNRRMEKKEDRGEEIELKEGRSKKREREKLRGERCGWGEVVLGKMEKSVVGCDIVG